ncbi:response regulator [Lachnospiraceae bacterium OttesenSCG-928-D06]|nr:response regulator [Lachnospiraceae bacterium OttesenSCG-928-D06]
MYRALIIDDEEIVRNGIRDLLDWNEAGFEICGEGVDGRDGLEKILRYQPHLVLVDIKMPGLSGIEVIEEARKRQFEGQFIILTGFSEFEFAKSAISLGVKEYLLKPIDDRELVRIIQNI